jgi:hypothetical protein
MDKEGRARERTYCSKGWMAQGVEKRQRETKQQYITVMAGKKQCWT